MAKNPKPWQAAFRKQTRRWPENRDFPPLSRLGTHPAKLETKPLARRRTRFRRKHIMFKSFEAKKSFSALVCTVLFSATCVLSAVGPAGAVEVRPVSVVSHPLA
jgi:hypothetical protein